MSRNFTGERQSLLLNSGYDLRLVEGSRSVARVSIELGQQKYKEGNIKKGHFGILKKMVARLSSGLKYHIG